MLIAAGTVLEGKYRVERLLGAGGMGSVWIAEHTKLGRPVAVKVLDKAAAAKDGTAVTRFLREAQTAARLRSDHIVDVLDVGAFPDGTPFLIMELLEGETLASRIRGVGRLPGHEAAHIADQLLDALFAAHNAGVIHRDIKPDNCFILKKSGRDHLKLLDFGISKVAGDAREMRMTRTGVVMGTPYYMAPEQARGSKEIDHRCDLYAAGAIMYECVTGRVPFDAESVNELLFKIVLEPLIPPRAIATDLDPALEHVILTAMSREANDRFQTAQAFRDALVPFGGGGRSTGTIGEHVVRTTPPPARSAPPPSGDAGSRRSPVSGVEATAPIDSDAMRAVLAGALSNHAASNPHSSSRPSSNTPSGLHGLAATGGHHVSESPRPRRGGIFVAAGVATLGALVGGAFYFTSHRTEPTPVAGVSPASPAPSPIVASANSFEPLRVKPPRVEKEKEKEKAIDPAPVKTPSPEPPASASSLKGSKPTAGKPRKQGGSAPVASPVSPPAQAAPPPPMQAPPPPSKGGSPRPIDTAL